MVTVLITGCSKHSKEIVDCLKENEDGEPVRVIATNLDDNKVLRHGTDACYILPRIDEPGYIDALLDVCIKEKVNVILPYITAELELLAAKRHVFSQSGIKVSVSSPESLRVLNDKISMKIRHGDIMPVEVEVENIDQLHEALRQFRKAGINQLCCKINSRCGGAGFAVIDNEKAYDISLFNRCGINRYIGLAELERVVSRGETKVIIQEYVTGTDYSVCVLADHGNVTHICGYAGYDMEYGAVVNGEILYNKKAYAIAERVAEAEGLDGNACFDFILTDDGSVMLLECNPRINASIGFIRKAGCNMVWLRCKNLLGMDVADHYNIQYGLRMSKYYEAEYF